MGTLAAGKYLEANLEDLYAEVKNRRFSMLIKCRYDARRQRVTEVAAHSPIYRLDGLS
ncbi:MAG: hypothetical protein ACRCYU_22325 [Nocardioides sp.]